MGLGDGLSSQAEAQYLNAQRNAQERTYDEDPTESRSRVVDDMVAKGFEPEDARTVVDTMAAKAHRSFFVDFISFVTLLRCVCVH